MALENRSNDYLDADDSNESDFQSRDSDNDVKKGGRATKRQRFNVQPAADSRFNISNLGLGFKSKQEDGEDRDDGDGSPDFDEDDEASSDDEKLPLKPGTLSSRAKHTQRPIESKANDIISRIQAVQDSYESTSNSKVELPLDLTIKLATRQEKIFTPEEIKRSGLIYISRMPPSMRPHKLKSLLSKIGPVNRTYLLQESKQARTKRVRSGGSRKKQFTEGWVELVDKKEAKKAVDLLNGQTMGGKKGSLYRDDVWCLRYLTGFKWNHLMDQLHREKEER